MTDKIDREIMQQALDALIENARLLGITQAKRGYGFYSQEDAIFERAFHECIAKHSAVLLERLAQPERERMSKMTDRELLEQAHDALYKEDRISGYANYGKLRKALRERLAQPDPRNQCGETCERAKLCAVCLAQMEKDPIQLFTDVQQEIETVLAQPEQEQITTDCEIIHQAVQTVIQAMQYDPEYAWGWHCNIAMAFVDAGGDRYTANQGAARFLEMFAKVQPAHELPAPEQDMVAYEIEAKLKEKNT
jgi:hypothetical protein